MIWSCSYLFADSIVRLACTKCGCLTKMTKILSHWFVLTSDYNDNWILMWVTRSIACVKLFLNFHFEYVDLISEINRNAGACLWHDDSWISVMLVILFVQAISYQILIIVCRVPAATMRLRSRRSDCESVQAENIFQWHHCIRAAAGRCWTRQGPSADPAGQDELLAHGALQRLQLQMRGGDGGAA